MQASDAQRFQNLNQSLDFTYQAIANGIAQHAELRRVEIEKEKQKKLAAASTPVTALWFLSFGSKSESDTQMVSFLWEILVHKYLA